VIAAISVVGPTFRISDDDLHTYGVIIAQHAVELGLALG
jgi:DNA-binding IclR family transcriptional regulator